MWQVKRTPTRYDYLLCYFAFDFVIKGRKKNNSAKIAIMCLWNWFYKMGFRLNFDILFKRKKRKKKISLPTKLILSIPFSMQRIMFQKNWFVNWLHKKEKITRAIHLEENFQHFLYSIFFLLHFNFQSNPISKDRHQNECSFHYYSDTVNEEKKKEEDWPLMFYWSWIICATFNAVQKWTRKRQKIGKSEFCLCSIYCFRNLLITYSLLILYNQRQRIAFIHEVQFQFYDSICNTIVSRDSIYVYMC